MAFLRSNYPSSFSLPAHGPWVLFLVWLFVQAFVFFHYGVVDAVDSDFYLTNAQLFLQGHVPTDRGIWYSSYSLFLACVIAAGGNLTSVVCLQFFFSGLAAIALYKLVGHLSQNHLVAFLAVLLYILWFKIHQWNSYIYTESLFISFSILSLALLSLSKKNIHYFFTALIIGFTLFLRPTGICFLVATCAYLCFIIVQKKGLSRSTLFVGMLGLMAVLLVLLNKILEEYVYYFIDSYSKAELIYPNINLGFSAPSSLDLPNVEHAPLFQLIEFVGYNPLYFLKLFCLKFLLFWGNVKPYFSWTHNLLVLLVLYPIYAFAIYGFKKMKWSAENVWMITFVLMQTVTISVTSENWDGRFLILILPFVFIYAAYGIQKVWENIPLNRAVSITPQK